jgi:energy-coupling factor transporter ATP-binding protein EcfA2
VLADEVFQWLAEQPTWQQDLARRLTTQVELDEQEYAEVLNMIKGTFGAPTVTMPPEPTPAKRDNLAVGTSEGTARLLALGSLQGVGLVVDGEELTFVESGLTIVYGQNAAGKSSYVRALKKLCRTVDHDCRIRPNIYEDTPTATPSARVRVGYDGNVTEQRTTLDDSCALRLAGMSVFDGACAELYVDAQNTVQYLPTELRLLVRLASLQNRLRGSLEEERNQLLQLRPPTTAYASGTRVEQVLSRLKGDATDPDLARLAHITDADRTRLTEVRGAIAAAEASTARTDADAADRDAADAALLHNDLRELHQRLASDVVRRVQEAVVADEEARQAVRLATEQMQGPVPGIGSGPWQLLWNSARVFVEGQGGTFPPAADAPCPLCLQSVTADTAHRLAHFDEHVSSTVMAVAEQRATELAQALDLVNPAHADAFLRNPLLVGLRQREPAIAEDLDTVTAAIRVSLDTLHRCPAAGEPTAIDLASATAALDSWAGTRRSRAAVLRAADDRDKLPGLRIELAELDARERLTRELDLFEAWRQRLQMIAALGTAHTALATNRITTAVKTMIEQDLSKALDAALTAELRYLAVSLPVEVRTNTARAETKVGVRLLANDGPRVSEIASEGERRALALCFFFAELEVANDLGGIVVDDPVSSLDDDRRIAIARRLVREAGNRQVIVFTHDLPFVFELRASADDAHVPCHVQHIWRQGRDVGRVDEHPPFKTMNFKQRVGRLDQDVAAMRQGERPSDNDEAWRQVEGFYKRVRTTWERAVEERLFAGVVERFERDVKTKSLKNLQITSDLIEQVNEGMTRASLYVHEDAYAAQVPLPSIQEMTADLKKLQAFEAETRLRQ